MDKKEQTIDGCHPSMQNLFYLTPKNIVIKAVRDCIAMAGGILCAAMTTLLLGL